MFAHGCLFEKSECPQRTQIGSVTKFYDLPKLGAQNEGGILYVDFA